MTTLIATGITVTELKERKEVALDSLKDRLDHMKDLLIINKLSNSEEYKYVFSLKKKLLKEFESLTVVEVMDMLNDIMDINLNTDISKLRKDSRNLLDNCYPEVLLRYERSLNDYIDLVELSKEKENKEYLFKINQDFSSIVSYNKKIKETIIVD